MDSSLAEQQRVIASDWGGGKSPFGTSWSKFMMWIFIISDALTFAGFLIAYGFMRMTAGSRPDAPCGNRSSPAIVVALPFRSPVRNC